MNKEIHAEEILTDLEIEKIALFNEDVVMKEAVRKILLRGIYENGTLKKGAPANPKQNFLLAVANNPTLDNAIIGQELRAAYWGITVLEQAFDKLDEIKRDDKGQKEESNIAE